MRKYLNVTALDDRLEGEEKEGIVPGMVFEEILGMAADSINAGPRLKIVETFYRLQNSLSIDCVRSYSYRGVQRNVRKV